MARHDDVVHGVQFSDVKVLYIEMKAGAHSASALSETDRAKSEPGRERNALLLPDQVDNNSTTP